MSYHQENSQQDDIDSSTGAAGTRSLVLNVARELLESPDVSIDDDFFSVGGDSILAMYLIGELARHTGLRVRVSLLLAHPVLREFCAEIEALGQADPRQPNDSETPLAAALRSVGTNRGGGDAD